MGHLKGLDPLLTADLLYILRSMGHGDKLLICDCNFPAATVATHTTTQKCIQLTTPSLPDALTAIGSVLPLDYFVNVPVHYMAPSHGLQLPPEGEQVLLESKHAIRQQAPDVTMEPVERISFYEQAKTCFAVVQTLERRPYGNFILQKGVVGPDGNDLKP